MVTGQDSPDNASDAESESKDPSVEVMIGEALSPSVTAEPAAAAEGDAEFLQRLVLPPATPSPLAVLTPVPATGLAAPDPVPGDRAEVVGPAPLASDPTAEPRAAGAPEATAEAPVEAPVVEDLGDETIISAAPVHEAMEPNREPLQIHAAPLDELPPLPPLEPPAAPFTSQPAALSAPVDSAGAVAGALAARVLATPSPLELAAPAGPAAAGITPPGPAAGGLKRATLTESVKGLLARRWHLSAAQLGLVALGAALLGGAIVALFRPAPAPAVVWAEPHGSLPAVPVGAVNPAALAAPAATATTAAATVVVGAPAAAAPGQTGTPAASTGDGTSGDSATRPAKRTRKAKRRGGKKTGWQDPFAR